MISTGAVNIFKKNLTGFTQSFWISMTWLYVEPLIMFLVFGYGIGSLVDNVGSESYFKFFYVGFIFATLMYVSFNESGFVFFTKIRENRVLKSYSLLPLTKRDVILGEIFWGAAKGFASTFILILLSLIIGILSINSLLPLVFLLIVCAFMFSAMGMWVSSISKDNNSFIVVQALFIFPMYFLSGVFFPLELLPEPLYALAMVFPLTHAVLAAKTLMSLKIDPIFFINLAVLFFYLFIFFSFATNKMTLRLRKAHN